MDETEKQQQPIIKKKFAEFVQLHGDLYEELTTPINNADYKLFKRDYTRSIVLTGVFCLFLLGLIGVAFSYADNNEPAIIITLVALIAMGVSLYFMYSTKKLLDQKKKFHIKGVISNKSKIPLVLAGERTHRIHTIEISERKNMTVTEKEYYQFTLGDIIHVEAFSADGTYRRKIKLLARI